MGPYNCMNCNRKTENDSHVCDKFMCRMVARLCVECGGEKDRTDLELCNECKEEIEREREANRPIPRDFFAYDYDVTR